MYLHTFSTKEQVVSVSLEERSVLKIVLMDSFNNLVPVSIEVPFVLDEVESIKTAIEYMHMSKSYHGLDGYLNDNARIHTIVIDEDIASLDVNKSFFSVDALNNRKVVEGLVKVIQGNSNIQEVVISIDGNLLETIPYTSIPIKNLFYSLPMNVFESHDFLHSSIPITKYFIETIHSNQVFVPTTFYMQGERTVDFVIDVFLDLLVDEGFYSYVSEIVNEYSLDRGKLSLDLNQVLCFEEATISENVLNLLLLMLFDNLPISAIELSIDGQPYVYQNSIQTITRKDLVYNMWKI